MNNLKKFIFKILGVNGKKKLILFYKIYRTNTSLLYKIRYFFKIIFTTKVVKEEKKQGDQFSNLYSKIKIKFDLDEEFIYFIDFTVIPSMSKPNSFGNLTVDYNEIMNSSISDLKEKYNSKSSYDINMLHLLNGIDKLIDRIIGSVNYSNIKNKDKIISTFTKIKSGNISTTFEAMQKILFYNQLLWQSDVTLVGLGRLDKILIKYYESDLNTNNINSVEIKKYIKSFYRLLHKDFYFKSGALVGDTGQIIILGGLDNNNEYFCNDLTYLFIESLMEINVPDPKILLRVSENMPKDLLDLSLKCMCTGIGSPLFANDDVIIKKLKHFGWGNDSYNYVTSACWEPFLASKTSDQNNIKCINFVIPFNDMLDNEDLSKLNSDKMIIEKYSKYLNKYLEKFKIELNDFNFNNNCLLSLFYPNCYKTKKDIGAGGALYNNYGVTSVGLSSVVNSILNINKIVFEDKKYTLEELNRSRLNDFNQKEIELILKDSEIRYGMDENVVIDLTNNIIDLVNKSFRTYKNKFAGQVKFGLSSPSYIIDSKSTGASLDGRKNGEPFTVHISSSKAGYTELFGFASKLEYGDLGFNGNVIDFMSSPSFIKKNYDKFIEFMKLAIKNGYFEMQMNVIDSKTLIKAKANPKLFPNLIVRVWGFSTYFNELPLEYKNLLIERAIANENNNN